MLWWPVPIMYGWLARSYSFLGQRGQAAHNAQRALEEAQQGQDALTTGRAYCIVTFEDIFAGRLLQAVEHGERAVALLEGTTDRFMLGRVCYPLAGRYYFLGNLVRALEPAARGEAIGAATGDRRVQTYGATLKGIALAAGGNINTDKTWHVTPTNSFVGQGIRPGLGHSPATAKLCTTASAAEAGRSAGAPWWAVTHAGSRGCARPPTETRRSL